MEIVAKVLNEKRHTSSPRSHKSFKSKQYLSWICSNHDGKRRPLGISHPFDGMSDPRESKRMATRRVFTAGLIQRTSLASSNDRLRFFGVGSRMNPEQSSLQRRIDIISVRKGILVRIQVRTNVLQMYHMRVLGRIELSS